MGTLCLSKGGPCPIIVSKGHFAVTAPVSAGTEIYWLEKNIAPCTQALILKISPIAYCIAPIALSASVGFSEIRNIHVSYESPSRLRKPRLISTRITWSSAIADLVCINNIIVVIVTRLRIWYQMKSFGHIFSMSGNHSLNHRARVMPRRRHVLKY